jgi:Zn-finger nucleic acid-binding protein
MTCPRCSIETETRKTDDVEIDACPRCAGVFLDRGELNRVAEKTDGDLEYSTLQGKTEDAPDDFGPIACPSCGRDPMAKVEFLVYSGIVLDHCNGCGGFWLDGKELERINEEVRELNESSEELGSSPMDWFAQFLYGLPR